MHRPANPGTPALGRPARPGLLGARPDPGQGMTLERRAVAGAGERDINEREPIPYLASGFPVFWRFADVRLDLAALRGVLLLHRRAGRAGAWLGSGGEG